VASAAAATTAVDLNDTWMMKDLAPGAGAVIDFEPDEHAVFRAYHRADALTSRTARIGCALTLMAQS
jgi:hypothetical protein